MLSTTQGKMYFVVLNSSPIEKLEFQFVPDEMHIDRNMKVEGVAIVGKNIPDYQYTGGETRLPLRLDFHCEDEDRKDVMYKVKWLESLTYNEGLTKSPPQLKVVYGDMYKNEIWEVLSFYARLSLFDQEYGFLPKQAYVDIVLGLANNFKASEINRFKRMPTVDRTRRDSVTFNTDINQIKRNSNLS